MATTPPSTPADAGPNQDLAYRLPRSEGEPSRKQSHSCIKRLTMALRLARILNNEAFKSSAESSSSPAGGGLLPPQESQQPRVRKLSEATSLRIICRIRSRLGRGSRPKKRSKVERKKAVQWRKYSAKKTLHDSKPSFTIPEPKAVKVDREITIELTTTCSTYQQQVRYNVTTGVYQPILHTNYHLDLLDLPSRVVHKNDAVNKFVYKTCPPQPPPQQPASDLPIPVMETEAEPEDDSEEDADEEGTSVDNPTKEVKAALYEDMVTQEHLDMLDSQVNPFNFSERVSQTTRHKLKNLKIQTDPPPNTYFTGNVGRSTIYDAYERHHEFVLLEKQKDAEKEQQGSVTVVGFIRKNCLNLATTTLLAAEPTEAPNKVSLNLPGLRQAAVILERMINQNIYDDIVQDFMYWEDGSDEYHPLHGSLLPLWKFASDNSRPLVVSDICWSPVYRDLFAAAYTNGEAGVGEGAGMLCLYTLKNPATPERIFHAHSGVTCVHLHPKYGNMVSAGWNDGTVVVYDVTSVHSPTIIYSTPGNGKHLLPVTRVRWIETEAQDRLSLYSVSLDGRVTQWQVTDSSLLPCDVVDLTSTLDMISQYHPPAADSPPPLRQHLRGLGTCIAFKPDDVSQVLLGVDTGSVYQLSTSCPSHTLTRYPAHTASVRDIAWNSYHYKVFISCSLDWTVKIWLQYILSPLMTLDMGGAVAGVQWASYSSSVFVAVTDDGCVHVYDIFLRKTHPMCSQRLLRRRQMIVSCLSLSPWYPVILVGGERGYLLALKLSPNLRKIYSNPKGFEELSTREIELSKLERIIAVTRGVKMRSDACVEEDRPEKYIDSPLSGIIM